MESIVALDIETTGLDPVRDAIIEIGAVRFKGRRVEREFQTLINPRRAIPREISQLTGITNAMVQHAPRLAEISAELVDFVGDSPVVGHNVKFDLGFLQQRDLLPYNEPVDTYAMAAALLPSAGRYNLGALGRYFNIPLPATHRALDDARVTHVLFLHLLERIENLPIDVLAEIVRLGDGLDWGADWVFRQVMRDRYREVNPRGHQPIVPPVFAPRRAPRPAAPLIPDPDAIPLESEEVAAILEFGGEFSRYFDQFEHRPQQVEVLKYIAWCLSERQHLLIEAGTGTGKSFAYLIPSALFAIQNNTRVVVSTNTINLQDQLVSKDIPDIRNALGVDLRTVVLKGRSNYICPRRLNTIRARSPENADEMRVLAKVLIWMLETETGDRQEITLNGPIERMVWERMSAADDGCTSDTCSGRMGGVCPFYRKRQAAQTAHIIVVNHALLLADVATGNRVLPDYEYLVVDEAHHMESAVTNALSFRQTQRDAERILRELGGTNAGTLGRLLTVMQDVMQPGHYGSLHRLVETATDQAFQFQNSLRNFFVAIDTFLEDQREGRNVGMYGQQVRILPSTRTLPAWMDVEVSWDETMNPLTNLLGTIETIATELATLNEAGFEETEDVYGSVTNLFRRLMETHKNLNGLVFEPDPNAIYWAEVSRGGRRLALNAAPLHIGPLMVEHLWHKKTAMVLTSATLTSHGDFGYIRRRLEAIDAHEVQVGSPFDYESQAMLYVINDIPEPSDRNGHQRAVDQGLIQLARATGGRILALFTSYAQLQATAKNIAPALARDNITVLSQGSGSSPHTLVESFKETENAILLGTRSFWEGVDIPGDALSVLAIIKIPFDVPSDPIVAARSETFENAFQEYTLPEAILRFRQGFGRLIRTRQDRGVVVVFDRRLLTKMYGRMFVESLPPCTVKVSSLGNMARETATWLNL